MNNIVNMSENTDIQRQISELSRLIGPDCRVADLFYRRGKLYGKCGRRAEAITDFNSAVALDPQSPAGAYLDMTTDIMDFYNTDLYNP